MKRLVIESWMLLLYFEWMMCFREFKEMHRFVRETAVHTQPSTGLVHYQELCRAMDYACVFYFKQVLCLQRSAATTMLLRRHGWNTDMVIGAQVLPFKSHAWCEINGAVVNDKPYMCDIYKVLERC